MSWTRLVFTLMILMLLAACGGPANTEPTPPTMYYGEDICQACGMIISDARYASAYITKDGAGHKFDEIAGMVHTYLEQHPDVIAFFVHDYESQEWVRGEEATYVLSLDIQTPMGFGLIAFASSEAANTFAANQEEAKVMAFEALITHYQNEPLAFPGPWSQATPKDQVDHQAQHQHSQ